MSVTFLSGPAGSGKTHCCLGEIREALAASSEGGPLLMLAPKQATFELERRLLGMGVPGYTRLQILSFERLARFVLEQLGRPEPQVLSEEGRVMVLRLLLARHESELKVFKGAARTQGLAAQMSQVLREAQEGRVFKERLREAAAAVSAKSLGKVADKLADLALIYDKYQGWLTEHQLHDPSELLELAASALREANRDPNCALRMAGLWLDGFAEMTQQEIELLGAFLPCCAESTLAFCLEAEPKTDVDEFSIWALTSRSFSRCWTQAKSLGLECQVRQLELSEGQNRFARCPALLELAASWETPNHAEGKVSPGIELIECSDPEAEALWAVRRIREHVMAGGRYRDIAVTVRRMDDYNAVLQRTFRRHGIPFFADHREPMGHHPLAELTRSAFNMAANGWHHEEWFAALKTGLIIREHDFIDRLENIALKNGWDADDWQSGSSLREWSPDGARLLETPVGSFKHFLSVLAAKPSGAVVAAAIRRFWKELKIPDTLGDWQSKATNLPPIYRSIHLSAWEQINSWCDNLEMAFADFNTEAPGWLQIAEAGLSGLTVGVIPPALDQVLIGAIDRTRQPEIKLTILMGANEGVFPGVPAPVALLTYAEREWLAGEGVPLGLSRAQSVSRERYYMYIACTRPSEKLAVTWARRDGGGKALAASALVNHLARFVTIPGAKFEPEIFDGLLEPHEAKSLPELFECKNWNQALPKEGVLEEVLRDKARQCARMTEQLFASGGASLNPCTVDTFYKGKTISTSVSGLEKFAECPFKFFASRGLRLKEREEFKIEESDRGSLLHEVLHRYHSSLVAEKKQWRDVTPVEAARRVRKIGEEVLRDPGHAVFLSDETRKYEAQQSVGTLGEVVRQLTAWMATYAFDPSLVELGFGQPGGGAADLEAWKIDLGEGRELILNGRIDRIDCFREGDHVLVTVCDYKSSATQLQRAKFENGFQLQLLSYLAFLRENTRASEKCGGTIRPAGAFYVSLKPDAKTSARNATTEELEKARRGALQHRGRFDKALLERMDPSKASGQFSVKGNDPVEDLPALLDAVVNHLQNHARRILDGEASASPARFAKEDTACKHCEFTALCRFEKETGQYRAVKAKSKGEAKL